MKFIDPWGGRFREGSIAIPGRSFLGKDPAESPNLEAVFPDVTVGKRHIRAGEESILVASGVLGRF